MPALIFITTGGTIIATPTYEPMLGRIYPTICTTDYANGCGTSGSNTLGELYAKKSPDGKTISWYAYGTGTSADKLTTSQMNIANTIYYWIAIG